jgi:hypothetical protein
MFHGNDHSTEHVHRIALIGMVVFQLLYRGMEDVVDFTRDGHRHPIPDWMLLNRRSGDTRTGNADSAARP